MYTYYRSKVWGLEAHFLSNKVKIDQKYSVDIVDIVAGNCIFFKWNIYICVQRSIIRNHHSCVPMSRCVS